jgi:hypothetical protein
MALDPAVLAQPVAYPPRPAEPEADLSPPADVIDPRQLAYQRARAAVTERARWEFLDRSTHQAQQALASALELVARLEAQVQALEARQAALAPPAQHAPLPAPSVTTQDAAEVPVAPPIPETVGLYQLVEAALQQGAEAVSEPLPPVVSGGVQHAPVQPAAVPLQP